MTRVGKIARLPRDIREQLNCRLEDGVPGVEIVAWLNASREVRKVLKTLFDGRPINEQNLSDWKQGGFLDWQKQQEFRELVGKWSAHADDLMESAGGPLSDKASALLGMQYLRMIESMSTAASVNPEDWERLRELCRDLVALRRGDHNAERLKLDRERIHWCS